MRTMMEIFGSFVCRWKGNHRWMRRKSPVGHQSVCDRCGITRPIKHRKQGELK